MNKSGEKKIKISTILVILCIIVSSLGLISGVGAITYIYNSSEVSYDNSKSKMTSDNVQDAIDELYGAATDYTALRSMIYPVGSIYISVEDDTVAKVEARFGGEWEVFGSGKTLVGVDTSNTKFDTIEETGGSSTSTIEVANLPNHTHKYTPAGTNSYTTSAVTSGNQSANPTVSSSGYIKDGITGGSHTHANANGGNIFGLRMKSGVTDTTTYGLSGQASSGAWAGAVKGSTSLTSTTHKHDLPNHTHTLSGNHTHSITAANLKSAIGTITFSGTEKSTTECTNCSGTALDVQNPYITVYMYKRVS